MPTKGGILKVAARKAGHCPGLFFGLFFTNALLYKALSLQL
jgi:hypothetical protein